MMHAWRGHAYGPPDSLRWEEIADPELRDGQVRIAVKASAVNFPDVLFVAGTYQVKPTPPFIPGFEVSGTVLESRVATLPEGTRVSSTLDGSGGYATHAIGSAHNTTSIPDALPFDDAAALTLTYQTGWFALHRRARLQPGEWLLVHAGAGGVGSAAIQLGRAAGARVIATDLNAAKLAELGPDIATHHLDATDPAAIRAALSGTTFTEGWAQAMTGGSVKFDASGLNTVARPVMAQWRKGTLVTVWPQDLAKGKAVWKARKA
ncbi:MAG: hypothetical protein NVS4B10_11200 [Myxococcales bacterium]